MAKSKNWIIQPDKEHPHLLTLTVSYSVWSKYKKRFKEYWLREYDEKLPNQFDSNQNTMVARYMWEYGEWITDSSEENFTIVHATQSNGSYLRIPYTHSVSI